MIVLCATLFLATFCAVNGQACERLVPGLDRVSQGVDLASLDLKHDYSVNDQDGFVQKILEFHCTGKKKWMSPFNNIAYDLPDEIETIVSLPTGMDVVDTRFSYSDIDLKTSRSTDVGIDISIGKFGFGDSLSFKKDRDTMTNNSRFIAENMAYAEIAKVDFIPADYLTKSLVPYFTDYVAKNVPATFEANPAAYYELFKTYGTHYFAKANFGGQFLMHHEIDEKLRTTMDEKKIGNNAQASFLTFLKIHGGYEKDVQTVDKEFSDNDKTSQKYFGGQANLLETEGYKAWWPTVASNPWLYSGNLAPISNLIAEPIRSQINKAFTAYMYHKHLSELAEKVSWFLTKQFIGGQTAQTLLNAINAQNAVVMPDLATMNSIEAQIEDFLVTPLWFRSLTLCAHFNGDHCAPITTPTPAFKPCINDKNCLEPNAATLTLTPNQAGVAPWLPQFHIEMAHVRTEEPKNWKKFYYKFRAVVPPTAQGWAQNIKLCVAVSQACDIVVNQEVCVPANTYTGELGFATEHKKELFGLKKKVEECGAVSFRLTTIN